MPDLKDILTKKQPPLEDNPFVQQNTLQTDDLNKLLIPGELPDFDERLLAKVEPIFKLGGEEIVKEIAARRQSAFDQWVNGSGKFIGKALIYGGSGILALPVGIVSAISNKSFSSFFDNILFEYADKGVRWLDEALPNLRTRVEQEMSIPRQMLTSNFWADDFLGGAAFMVGAILSELATGGANTANIIARTGKYLKLLSRVKSVEEAARKGTAIKALSAFKTTAVGAVAESALEAYHAKQEMMEAFKQNYIDKFGFEPDEMTLREAEQEVNRLANQVFAMNMATVGTSNAIVLSKIFGKPLTNLIPSRVKRAFKPIKVVNGVATDVSTKGWRKYLKAGKAFLLNPTTEASQEVLQGLYSSSVVDYVLSKYSIDGAAQAYNIFDALHDYIATNELDKNTIKEGIIGGLLGLIGIPGAGNFLEPVKEGIDAVKGKSKYQDLIDSYNAATNNLKENLKGFIRQYDINQIADANSVFEAKNSEVEELFNFFSTRYNTNTFDQVEDDIASALDSMTNEEFAESFGYTNMPAPMVNQRKEELKTRIKELVEEYSKAREQAERISAVSNPEVIEGITYAIYASDNANKRLNQLVDELSEQGVLPGEERSNLFRELFNTATAKRIEKEQAELELDRLKKSKEEHIKDSKKRKKRKGLKKRMEGFDNLIAEKEKELIRLTKEYEAAKKRVDEEDKYEGLPLEKFVKKKIKDLKELDNKDDAELREKLEDIYYLKRRRDLLLKELDFLVRPEVQEKMEKVVEAIQKEASRVFVSEQNFLLRKLERAFNGLSQRIEEEKLKIENTSSEKVRKRAERRLRRFEEKRRVIIKEAEELSASTATEGSGQYEDMPTLFSNLYKFVLASSKTSPHVDEVLTEEEQKEEEKKEKEKESPQTVTSETALEQTPPTITPPAPPPPPTTPIGFTGNVISSEREFFILYQGNPKTNPYLYDPETGELKDEVIEAMDKYIRGEAEAVIQMKEVPFEPIQSNTNPNVWIQRGVGVDGKTYAVVVVIDGVEVGGLINPNRYTLQTADGLVPLDLSKKEHFNLLHNPVNPTIDFEKFAVKWKALSKFWNDVIVFNIQKGNMEIPVSLDYMSGELKDGFSYKLFLNITDIKRGKERYNLKDAIDSIGIDYGGDKIIFVRWGSKEYVYSKKKDSWIEVSESAEYADIASEYDLVDGQMTDKRLGSKNGRGALVRMGSRKVVVPISFPLGGEDINAKVAAFIEKMYEELPDDAISLEMPGRIAISVQKEKGKNVRYSSAEIRYTNKSVALQLSSPAFGGVEDPVGFSDSEKVFININQRKDKTAYYIKYNRKDGNTVLRTIGVKPTLSAIFRAISTPRKKGEKTILDMVKEDYNLEGLGLRVLEEKIDSAQTNIFPGYSASLSLSVRTVEGEAVTPQAPKTTGPIIPVDVTKEEEPGKATTQEESEEVEEKKKEETPPPEEIPDDPDIDFTPPKEEEEGGETLDYKDPDAPFSIRHSVDIFDSTFEEEVLDARTIVGENVPIRNLEELVLNIRNRGITFGAVYEGAIYLNKQQQIKGRGAHEAFHYVTRAFLTEEELDDLFSLARDKYGKPNREELLYLRSSSSQYRHFSDAELELVWLEEKLADDFADYFVERKERSVFRKLFDKLIQWIRRLLNIDPLDAFFYDAATGKYRKGRSKYSSPFVHFSIKGVRPLFKEKSVVPAFISAKDYNVIVSMIAYQVMRGKTFEEGLEYARNKFSPQVWEPIIKNSKASEAKKKAVKNRILLINTALHPEFTVYIGGKKFILPNKAFDNNIDLLKEKVNAYRRAFSLDKIDDGEELDGVPKEYFNRTADRNAGFSSMSRFFRQYLSTVWAHYDYFSIGIDDASDNKHLFPLSADALYRKLLVLTRNRQPNTIFTILSNAAKTDVAIRYFLERVYRDIATELDRSDLDELSHEELLESPTYNLILTNLHMVENTYVDTVVRKRRGRKTLDVNIYNANGFRGERMQKEQWQARAALLNTKEEIAAAVEGVTKALDIFRRINSVSDIGNPKLLYEKANAIREGLEKVGISLHVDYIAASLVRKVADAVRSSDSAFLKNMLLDDPGVSYWLNHEFFSSLKNSIEAAVNGGVHISTIFSDRDKGVSGRLISAARGNSYYDPEFRLVLLRNSEGEPIYPVHNPSFLDEFWRFLRDVKRDKKNLREELERIFPGYPPALLDIYVENIKDNQLFNDRSFPHLILWNLFGIRNDDASSAGSEFKDLDTTSKTLVRLILYAHAPAELASGRVKKRLFLPTVWEDKRTAKAVPFDVRVYTDKGKLTERGRRVLKRIASQDEKRIQRVQEVYEALINEEPINIPLLEEYHYTLIDGDKYFDYNGKTYRIVEDAAEEVPTPEGYISPRGLQRFDSYDTQNIEEYINERFEDFVNFLLETGILFIQDGKLQSRNLPTEKGLTAIVDSNGIVNKDILYDFFVTDFIVSAEFASLIYGDVGMIHKSYSDVIKRNSGVLGAGENLGPTNIAFIRAHEESIDNELVRKNNADPVQDAQDAQSYTHVGWFFNKYLRRMGRYHKSLIPIYKKLRAGIPLKPKEFEALKRYSATAIDKKPVARDLFYYIKTSAHTVLRESVSIPTVGKKAILEAWEKYDKGKLSIDGVHKLYKPVPGREYLHALLNAMESSGVDMAVTTSASKLVTHDIGDFDGSSFQLSSVTISTMREQVRMDRVKDTVAHGVQLMSLVISEQDMDREITTLNKKKAKIGDIVKAYQKILSARSLLGLEKITKTIFTKKGEVNYRKIYDRIVGGLEAGKTSFSLIEALGVADKRPKYSWNLPSVNKKVQESFRSVWSKNALSFRVPGVKFTLVSDYGYTVLEDEYGAVVPRKRYQPNMNVTPRRLRFGVKKEGVYYAEAIVPEHVLKSLKIEIGDFIPTEELEYLLGYRIPTQDKHSMVVLKVVDTLPSMNESSIIVPKEVIYLSGADFDIDALYTRTAARFRDRTFGRYATLEEAYDEWLHSNMDEDIRAVMGLLDNEYLENLKDKQTMLMLKRHGLDFEAFKEKYESIILKNIEARKDVKRWGFTDVVPITVEEANNLLLLYELHLVFNEGNKDIATTKASFNAFTEEGGALKYFERLGINPKELLSVPRNVIGGKSLKENVKKKLESANKVIGIAKAGSQEAKAIGIAGKYANSGKYNTYDYVAIIGNDLDGQVNEGVTMRDEIASAAAASVRFVTDSNKTVSSHLKALGYKSEKTSDGLLLWTKPLVQREESLYDALSKINFQDSIDTGSEGVGPAALINAIMQHLILRGVVSNIPVFGKTTFSYLTDDGKRVNDYMSTIISTMVDNAKVLFASRFGIHSDVVSSLLGMVSMGVPFNKALLVLVSPAVRVFSKNLKRYSQLVEVEGMQAFSGDVFERAYQKTISDLGLDPAAEGFSSVPSDADIMSINKETMSSVFAEFHKAFTVSRAIFNLSRIKGLNKSLGALLRDDRSIFEAMNALGISYSVKPVDASLSNTPYFDNGGLVFRSGDVMYRVELKKIDPNTAIEYVPVLDGSDPISTNLALFIAHRVQAGKIFVKATPKFINHINRIKDNTNRFLSSLNEDFLEDAFISYLSVLRHMRKTDQRVPLDMFIVDEKNQNILKSALVTLKGMKKYRDNLFVKSLRVERRGKEKFIRLQLDNSVYATPEYMEELSLAFMELMDPAIPLVLDHTKIATDAELAKYLAYGVLMYGFVADGMMYRSDRIVSAFHISILRRFAESVREIEDVYLHDGRLDDFFEEGENILNEFAATLLRNRRYARFRRVVNSSWVFSKNRKDNLAKYWLKRGNRRLVLSFAISKDKKEKGTMLKNSDLRMDAWSVGLYGEYGAPYIFALRSRTMDRTVTTLYQLKQVKAYDNDVAYLFRIEKGKVMKYRIGKGNSLVFVEQVSRYPYHGFEYEYEVVSGRDQGNFLGFGITQEEMDAIYNKEIVEEKKSEENENPPEAEDPDSFDEDNPPTSQETTTKDEIIKALGGKDQLLKDVKKFSEKDEIDELKNRKCDE